MQLLTTEATFDCPICHRGAAATVKVPEPNWGASDKISDLGSEDQTTVDCDRCKEKFPAYVRNNASGCEITLDDYPDTVVKAKPAFFSGSVEDEDWINQETPKDPATMFLGSFFEVRDILAEYGVAGRGILKHSGPLINRMVFTQQISALEAYLGDTLINLAMKDSSVLHQLLIHDRDLKDVRVPLETILSKPDLVKEIVRKHLQEVLYHNLAKVEALFRIATKGNIWPTAEIKEKLFKAISFRHDCVHRNGNDRNGNPLSIFTTEYVDDILLTMLEFVKHIEKVCVKSQFAPEVG